MIFEDDTNYNAIDIVDTIISNNSPTQQNMIAVEEMSELQKEIIKYLRGKGNREHLLEEIADVHIMLLQLERIHCFTNDEISQEMTKKLYRYVVNHPNEFMLKEKEERFCGCLRCTAT